MFGAGDGPIHPGSAVPSFSFPEQAAGVLGRIAAYSRWRRTEGDEDGDEPPDHLDVTGADAVTFVAAARRDGIDRRRPGGRRPAPRLLRRHDASHRAVTVPTDDPADVADVADELGFPVAVKSTGGRRAGRSAEAGVALDLGDRADDERAVPTMRSSR